MVEKRNPYVERRFGAFKVDAHFIESMPEQVTGLLFGSIIVLEAKQSLVERCFYYLGASMLFDPVGEFTSPPFYELNLKRDDGSFSLQAIKLHDQFKTWL